MIIVLAISPDARGQTVWSGFSHTFSKATFADVTNPANQDRITDSVWLTRNVNEGLFNIRQESGYDGVGRTSPAGTRWATDLILENEGKTIAATNYANLAFDHWVFAYGGPLTRLLPQRILGRNAVVHLVAEDIYLDLRFTEWTGAGGGFAYERAVGLPPPTTTGDYNSDGKVDAADYVIWRATHGQTVSPTGSGADGNANGMIDDGDYDFWRARFGNIVSGAGGGALAIPEPAAPVLLLAILLALANSRRARQICTATRLP